MAFRLQAPKPLEKDIQRDILQMLRVHPKVAWAERMNTGAHPLEHNGKKRFVRYGFVGLSDIIGQLKSGEFLALEVKRPGNTPTAAQHAFLDSVSAAGGVSGWADNLDDAIRIVES